MVEAARVDTAAILNEASGLVGAYPFSFLGIAGINLAFGTWLDMQPASSWNAILLSFAAGTVFAGIVQYAILRRVLDTGADGSWVSAIRTLLVAVTIYLLVTLVVGAGYLLLLIPGLYLAARLSPAIGLAVVERRGVVESIGESWRRSRPAWRALLLVQGLLLLPLVGLSALVVAGTHLEWGFFTSEDTSFESALLGNLTISAMAMAAWATGGAAYRLTIPGAREIDQVFA